MYFPTRQGNPSSFPLSQVQKGMKIRGIARDLLQALLSSAREVDREGGGREFVAVLREEDGVIREFLFLPFTSTPGEREPPL